MFDIILLGELERLVPFDAVVTNQQRIDHLFAEIDTLRRGTARAASSAV